MLTFPLLNSGAIAQYPTPFAIGQGVQVIRFVDGADQRFLTQGRQFRRWQISLTQLSEDEMQALAEFVVGLSGDYSTFAFVNPFDGTTVLNCRLGSPDVELSWDNFASGSTSLWVLETNG